MASGAVEAAGVERVIIIGSGPAGLTAAVYAARANLQPLVLAGGLYGGQLMLTTDVENYPGFPEGILGPELMIKFREQAERFGARIENTDVTSVDFAKRPLIVRTDDAEHQTATVIVATGASARWLDIPGEERLRGRGVSSCATCDGAFFRDKHIIVVGGGDSAMEEALFLTRFGSRVTVIHRRDRRQRTLARRTGRGAIAWVRRLVVRDLRRRVLSRQAHCRHRRRRFSDGRSALSHALRLTGDRRAPARLVARQQNHGRSRA